MELYTLPQELSDKIETFISKERNMESFYKAASIWCDMNGFKKASKFFVNEMHGERRHSHKLERFLTDWGVFPTLPQYEIVQPDSFSGLVDIVNKAAEKEYELCDLYDKEYVEMGAKNGKVAKLIGCFVKFQQSEVKAYNERLKILDGCKNDKFTLLSLSKKLFK